MTLEKRSSFRITKAVIFALVLREMRGRFGRRRFGAFWVFFEPGIQVALIMTIYTFRGLTVRNGIDFPLFLVSGIIPFYLMRNMALQTMGAVDGNRALFAYKQIKPMDTMFARAIVETAIYAVVYAIFMFILGFFFKFEITLIDPIKWLMVLSIGLLLSFSLGVLFCLLVDVLPEFKTFLRIIFFPIYLLSGVLYPIWIMPREIMDWLLWIPYLHIIDELRMATFPYYPDHYGVNLMYPLKFAVIVALISFGLYRIRRLRLVAI